MAEIAPFTPLRYDLEKLAKEGGLAKVVAPPYDVIDAQQRAELAARHQHNVVKLILPEGEGDRKYANAAELYAAWRKEGVLVRDEEPAFYRYDQTFTPPGGGKPRTRTGFLGVVRLVPLDKGVVLPHERTLSGPKEDRLKLFRATKTNFSPGFLLYRDPEKKLDAALATAKELATFETEDGVKHRFSKIADKDAIRAIVEGVATSSLLIADGHHRYETALRYSQENAGKGDRPESAYFMEFFCNGDDPDLVVFPTHRHVHSLPSFDYAATLEKVKALFDVTELPPGASADVLTDALAKSGAERPSLVIAAGDSRAALLALKKDADLAGHPVLGPRVAPLRKTDVALLHMGILEPVLGVTPEMQAAKSNIWYPQDAAAALKSLRDGKGQTLFLMNGTPVAQVREVAEAGEVMPQKSTFFYPKVLTGLAINTLEEDRSVPTA
ncbi:MAG: DUF1015 domain-containing protein [Labilithrix sp.]|nr:DUF1015 domain-containing protein [Labilithrix sp.]MCW5813580.1 DUF1015 domain-containing protein [Labilithrix sp.]